MWWLSCDLAIEVVEGLQGSNPGVMALIRTLDYCHYASIIALQRSGGARFLGSSRSASSLDAGVVGSVDESFDRLARVVQEVRHRGGDQEADWEGSLVAVAPSSARSSSGSR